MTGLEVFDVWGETEEACQSQEEYEVEIGEAGLAGVEPL